MDKVYEPQDDSYLLAEQVKRFAFGDVLDMGTGVGVQAIAAAKKKNVNLVVATDINEGALRAARKNAEKEKIKIRFIKSDLFQNVKEKFDTIIFNPPYLPDDVKFLDRSVHGGKLGYETLERFFSQANNYLSDDGVILVVFSSLTKKDKVDEAVENYGFEKRELAQKRIFFEMLYVYLIKKSALLKELNKKGLKEVKRFAKGHRGIIYTAFLKNRKMAVKAKRKDSKAKGRMRNEALWLKKLNKKGIGPKILFEGRNYFVYEFVEGDFISDYFVSSNKEKIIKMIKELFLQCFAMDLMKINKEEMHHPFKHIIVNKKPVLVDFERTHKTKKPQNVTQFCQFLMNKEIKKIFKNKGISFNNHELISAAKHYRKNVNKESLQAIMSVIDKKPVLGWFKK